MIDKLIERMKYNGLKFPEDSMMEVRRELKECLDNDRFLFIERCDKTIGFLTWKILERGGKKYCFINNLYIEKNERNTGSLLGLRRGLRRRIGERGIEFYYWRKQKNGRFVYVI